MKKIHHTFFIKSILFGCAAMISCILVAQDMTSPETIDTVGLSENTSSEVSPVHISPQSPYDAEIRNLVVKPVYNTQAQVLNVSFDITNTTDTYLYDMNYTTQIVGDFRGTFNPTQEFLTHAPYERFSLAPGASRQVRLALPLPKSLPANDLAFKVRLLHEGQIEQWKMSRFNFARGGGVFFMPQDFSPIYKPTSPLQISGVNPNDLSNIAALTFTYASDVPPGFPVRTYLKTSFYRVSDAQMMKVIQSNVAEIGKNPHTFSVDVKNISLPPGEYTVITELYTAHSHEKIGGDTSANLIYKTLPYQVRGLSIGTTQVSLFQKIPLSFELVGPIFGNKTPQTLRVDLINQRGKVVGSIEQSFTINYREKFTTNILVRRPFEQLTARIRVMQDSATVFQYDEKIGITYGLNILFIGAFVVLIVLGGAGVFFLKKKNYHLFAIAFIGILFSGILFFSYPYNLSAQSTGLDADIGPLIGAIRNSQIPNPYLRYPYINPYDGTNLQQFVTARDDGKVTPVPENNFDQLEGFFELVQPKITLSRAVDCETGVEFSNNEIPQGTKFCIDVSYEDKALAIDMLNTVVLYSKKQSIQYPNSNYKAIFDIIGAPSMRDMVELRSGKGRTVGSVYYPKEWQRELRYIHEFDRPIGTLCPTGYNSLNGTFGIYCSRWDAVNMPLSEGVAKKSLSIDNKRFGPYQAKSNSLGFQDKTVVVTTTHQEYLDDIFPSGLKIPSYSISAYENKLFYGITVVCPAGFVQIGTSCVEKSVCGTNAQNFVGDTETSFPGNFCDVGTSAPASPAFPATGTQVTWSCNGTSTSSTLDDVTCSASLCGQNMTWDGTKCLQLERPICGIADKRVYSVLSTGYGTDSLCARGTPDTTLFPAIGSRQNWNCFLNTEGNIVDGASGGPWSISCSAVRCNYGEIVVGDKCVPKAQCGDNNNGIISPTCGERPRCGTNVTLIGGLPTVYPQVFDTGSERAYCASGQKVVGIHTYYQGFPVSQNMQWYCVNPANPDCTSGSMGACYNAGDAVACYAPYWYSSSIVPESLSVSACQGTVGYRDGKAEVIWSLPHPRIDDYDLGNIVYMNMQYAWQDETGLSMETVDVEDRKSHTSIYTSNGQKEMRVTVVYRKDTYTIGKTVACSVTVSGLEDTPVQESVENTCNPTDWCTVGTVFGLKKDENGNYTWECRGYDGNGNEDDVTCGGNEDDGNNSSAMCTADFSCQDGQTWNSTTNTCEDPTCPNGANNPPTCNTCTLPQVWSSITNTCENPCTNGANNPPTCNTCTLPQVWSSITNTCENPCTNGANNPPTCNTCTAPQVWSSITNTCENPCTNGANNPPTCNTCTAPQVWSSITNTCENPCTNGANNPPTCNTCTAPQVWSSITNTCENPCTNGANNPPTCNTCTAPKVWNSITNTCENPCTNGANNPPTCNTCTAPKVWNSITNTCENPQGLCGTRATTYGWDASNWPTGSTYCDLGTATVSPAFPDKGTTVTWQCDNGGQLSPVCSATRSKQPLCGLYSATFSGTLTNFPTGLSTTYCAEGTPSSSPLFPTTPGSSVSWTCSTGAGPVASCTATRGNICDASTLPSGQTACPGTPDPTNPNQPYTVVETCGTTACTFSCTSPQVWNSTTKTCGDPVCTNGANNPPACNECTSPQVWNDAGNECTCPVGTDETCACVNTVAPDELQLGLSKPVIQCKDTSLGTHFRYRIMGPSGFSVDSTTSYPVNTEVIHPNSFSTPGDYTVQCFYGDATKTLSQMTPGCTRTMSVKDSTNTPVCETISVGDPASLLTNPTIPDRSFGSSTELKFECRAKNTLPEESTFRLTYGTQAINSIAPDLLTNLTTGWIPTASPYPLFTLGTTEVRCFVSSGNGYSTSDACMTSICVGQSCIDPEPYKLIPIDNQYCTKEATTTYNIGCDPEQETSVYTSCRAYLSTLMSGSGTAWTGNIPMKVNNVSQNVPINCTSQNDGCKITLQSGAKIEIETYQPGKYQEMKGSILDTTPPDIDLIYRKNSLTGEIISSLSGWLNFDVVAVVKCEEKANQQDPDGECRCDTKESTLTNKGPYAGWTNTGNTSLLPHTEFFKKFTLSTILPQDIAVYDEREYKSEKLTIPAISIDKENPIIQAEVDGTDPTKIIFTLSDAGSGIDKYSLGNDSCNNTPQVGSEKSLIGTVTSYQKGDIISYCIQDKAGNKISGQYPFTGNNACFADESSTVDLSNYVGESPEKYGLIDRVFGQRIGYILTEKDRMDQNRVFQTRLANNINKYITSRFCPDTIYPSIWNANYSQTARVQSLLTGQCTPNSPGNKNGYFYYTGTGEHLTVGGDNIISINQPTVLYVVGSDVYIKQNIQYSTIGTQPSLVIIVQAKNGQGGNIYVDPSVTQIDGTLIADGALMNGRSVNDIVEPIVWITDITAGSNRLLDNRLTINGRLLTYNTRGGSLAISGSSLIPLQANGTDINTGKCIDSKTGNVTNCEWQDAAVRDLERFRFVSDEQKAANKQCTLYVTGDTTLRTPDILRTTLE